MHTFEHVTPRSASRLSQSTFERGSGRQQEARGGPTANLLDAVQGGPALNVFGKQRQALSGKVGGMKDDVAIALQLGIYFSSREALYA